MRMIMILIAVCGFSFLGGCGDDTDCKGACDTLSSCGLKSSGLSCDADCDQGDCAACVNETSCEDIEAGKCADQCPDVSFTKK